MYYKDTPKKRNLQINLEISADNNNYYLASTRHMNAIHY
jgi:hypothetical protein